MKNIDFFKNLTEKEVFPLFLIYINSEIIQVRDILLNYMEDLFVDPNKLILTPKNVLINNPTINNKISLEC